MPCPARLPVLRIEASTTLTHRHAIFEESYGAFFLTDCAKEQTNSTVEVWYRSFSRFRNSALSLLKKSSIGLRSGEYEGK